MGSLDGKIVCVVGGTAGMGLAIARRAHAQGARVILTSRSVDRATATAAAIGDGCSGSTLDILDPPSIESFFAETGPIDHLVVTAASVRGGTFADGSVEDAKISFDGKFWSQYLCARAARARASILFFSGALSRRPRAGTSAISAVNGAVEALGRALAVELAPVRVNVLSPGLVRDTAAYDGMPEQAREAMMAGAAARLPAGLVGGPDSVAAVAVSILESDYVNGAVIDVDGGGLLA